MTTPRPAPIVLFGPQRFHPSVPGVVARAGVKGPLAAITAGWQERESEDQELRDALGVPIVNLSIHSRAERVFREDPELFAAHRARQDRVRGLQELYRVRVKHGVAAVRALGDRPVAADLVASEREDAVAALRRLEEHHLGRLQSVHAAFSVETGFDQRPAVARERREIEAALAECEAVLVAGGHIAVLLNRMRLFSLAELCRDRPIFAWSAGAMAMTERVVVFHDSPPQGPGNAELFDVGLGLAGGVIVLPDAQRRLRLGDPKRVALLSQRFAPTPCVALDEGGWIARRAALDPRAFGHQVAPPGEGDGARAWMGEGLARSLERGGSVIALSGAGEEG